MQAAPLTKRRHVPNSILIENSRWDPVTGTTSAIVGAYAGMAGAAADIVAKPVAALRAPKPKASDLDSVPAERGSSSTSSTSERDAQMNLPQSNDQRGSGRGCMSTSSAVALGVASGVGSFFHNFAKGNLIDMPLAFTEGMRNAPRLYGGKVINHEPVTGWKSGFAVSGKNLGKGIGQGIFGIVQEPMRGAQQGGSLGAIRAYSAPCTPKRGTELWLPVRRKPSIQWATRRIQTRNDVSWNGLMLFSRREGENALLHALIWLHRKT